MMSSTALCRGVEFARAFTDAMSTLTEQYFLRKQSDFNLLHQSGYLDLQPSLTNWK